MSLLGWGLGLLIPGAGIAAVAVRFFAPTFFAQAVAFLKTIPTNVWIALAVVAALVGGYLLHQDKAHAALDAAYKRGRADDDADWRKALANVRAKATRARQQTEAQGATISKDIGDRNAHELQDIRARADDERLHGPGKAAAPACARSVDNPRVPAGTGGPVAASGAADSSVAGLPPAGGLAIVPWNDLVARGAEADGWRAEVIGWRDWYGRQRALNEKARSTPLK